VLRPYRRNAAQAKPRSHRFYAGRV